MLARIASSHKKQSPYFIAMYRDEKNFLYYPALSRTNFFCPIMVAEIRRICLNCLYITLYSVIWVSFTLFTCILKSATLTT